MKIARYTRRPAIAPRQHRPRGVPAHYEYAPFGALTDATTNTAFTAFNVAEINPFRFSSEYADDALGLVYYNYRHYEPVTGRWLSRDFANSLFQYGFVSNRPLFGLDLVGLAICQCGECEIRIDYQTEPFISDFKITAASGNEVFSIGFEALCKKVKETARDLYIKKFIDDPLKEILEATRRNTAKANAWSKIINGIRTDSWLFTPEMRMSSIIKYEKKSCVLKPWWRRIFSSKDDCCHWRYQNVVKVYSTNWEMPSGNAVFEYVSPFMGEKDIVSILGSMINDISNQLTELNPFYQDKSYYMDLLKKELKGSGCKLFVSDDEEEVL